MEGSELTWRGSDQSWTTYAVHLSSFNPPAVILDSLLGYTLCRALRVPEPPPYIPSMPTSLVIFLVWIMFTKTIKFMGHFGRYPTDLKFLPVLCLFSYLHGFIYLYSLLTLNKVSRSPPHTSFPRMLIGVTDRVGRRSFPHTVACREERE
ncbi:hypothetical protein XANCAGTX0491_005509 [Xanthoria calcicola]